MRGVRGGGRSDGGETEGEVRERRGRSGAAGEWEVAVDYWPLGCLGHELKRKDSPAVLTADRKWALFTEPSPTDT